MMNQGSQIDLNTPLHIDNVISNPYSFCLVSPFLLKGVMCVAQINIRMNILKIKSYRYLVIFTM